MPKKKKWISGAIEHPGSLRRWAKQHRAMRGNKINLSKAERIARRKGDEHRIRQINLARNLRKARK